MIERLQRAWKAFLTKPIQEPPLNEVFDVYFATPTFSTCAEHRKGKNGGSCRECVMRWVDARGRAAQKSSSSRR